mgnify:CR=1 FL=1
MNKSLLTVIYLAIILFTTIKLKAKKAASEIPDLQFSFFRFVIAINHFNEELTLILALSSILKPTAQGLSVE